jgi:hypothetical protein
VAIWGDNTFGQTNVAPGLSNIIQIAANAFYSVGLKSDGTVVLWGSGPAVPAGLSNVVQVAAGDQGCLALKKDGAVTKWGDMYLPAGLTNIVVLAAGEHNLALRADGTITEWAWYGQEMPPAGLTNVVTLSAQGNNSLALSFELRHIFLSVTNQTPMIQFRTFPVWRYVLEYSSGIAPAGCTNLSGEPVQGDGNNALLTDPSAPNHGARFYRIERVQ